MRINVRRFLALSALGAAWAFPAAGAKAQSTGSLGGYGAAPVYSNIGSGGGAMIIPYGGMFEGFMPSRMGGGNPLAFRSRPGASMGSSATSFSLAPLSGGMAQGRSARMAPAFGASSGMPISGAMGKKSSGPGGMSVMPPSFGYPFRQPPSLVPTATPGAGMSM